LEEFSVSTRFKAELASAGLSSCGVDSVTKSIGASSAVVPDDERDESVNGQSDVERRHDDEQLPEEIGCNG
jgi:hypothetical protein